MRQLSFKRHRFPPDIIRHATYNTFYHQRHLLKRSMYKKLRTKSFDAWQSASVAA